MMFGRDRVFELSQRMGKVAGEFTKVFVKDEVLTLFCCFPCALKMGKQFLKSP
jgi:hypothetical protein